jgi:tol-pal system protein YbgF
LYVLVALLAFAPLSLHAQEDLLSNGPPPENFHAPPPGMDGAPPAATDMQMRMNALETQLRNVTGQLERAQYQNSQLQQTLQRMNADYDGRFQMLERRLITQEAKSAAPPPPTAAAMPPSAPPAAPPASSAPPQGATDTPPPAPTTSNESDHTLGTLSSSGNTKPGDPQAMYDAAFQSLRQAKYDDAETRLRAFLKAYPKHKLAENARYWLGESYYVRSKFQDAAVTFAEGFQQFPAGSKAPDNLLKLAMSLGSIDKKQDACTTLTELKKRFPNASAIIRNRAEQERKNLSCS